MDSIEKAVEIAEDRNARREARSPEIRHAIQIVYNFMKKHDLLSYGGTAVNSLLPEEDKFYDMRTTIPDYDVFSETPQLHSMMLADELKEGGIHDVDVRPGVHLGTFKVFANYTGVADFTFLNTELFDSMWEDAIEKDKIMYANPNFLRMSMYLELSRPRGDVSRWSKVYSRLRLLNDAYPITCKRSDSEADVLEDPTDIETFLEDNNAVILGLHASQIHENKMRAWDLPIDLLVTSRERDNVVHKLKDLFDAKSETRPPIGEFVSQHTDIIKRGRLLVRVFETQACHSFHTLHDGTRVASIPTILQFFMSFLYADTKTRKELDTNRLLCVAQRLIDLADTTKHSRRFRLLTPVECLGDQETLTDVRTTKAKKFSEMKRDSPEFLKYFFSYNPTRYSASQKKKLKSVLKNTYRKRRGVLN